MDLLALLHVLLELAGFDLKLLILKNLLLDLFAQLRLGRFVRCDAFGCVFSQLLLLLVQALLVIFLLLDVFALDDLLGLLGDPVELHILCELLEVLFFRLETLVLILDLLELGLVDEDTADEIEFGLAALCELRVLVLDHLPLDEDGVLVVCGDGKLGNLDLALLQVYDHLKVVL